MGKALKDVCEFCMYYRPVPQDFTPAVCGICSCVASPQCGELVFAQEEACPCYRDIFHTPLEEVEDEL